MKSGYQKHDFIGVFITMPGEGMSFAQTFFCEGTNAFLLFTVVTAINGHTQVMSKDMQGIITVLAVALVFAVLCWNAGTPSGFSLNGAREIGPRVWALFMGYGEAWSSHWIATCGGSISGFLIGAVLYQFTSKLEGADHNCDGSEIGEENNNEIIETEKTLKLIDNDANKKV